MYLLTSACTYLGHTQNEAIHTLKPATACFFHLANVPISCVNLHYYDYVTISPRSTFFSFLVQCFIFQLPFLFSLLLAFICYIIFSFPCLTLKSCIQQGRITVRIKILSWMNHKNLKFKILILSPWHPLLYFPSRDTQYQSQILRRYPEFLPFTLHILSAVKLLPVFPHKEIGIG